MSLFWADLIFDVQLTEPNGYILHYFKQNFTNIIVSRRYHDMEVN